MVSDEARAGLPCDLWEERIIATCAVTALPGVTWRLMRPLAEVKEIRAAMPRTGGVAPRRCGRCRHYGKVGTCGVEIEGLARSGEPWEHTPKRGPWHECHLGVGREVRR